MGPRPRGRGIFRIGLDGRRSIGGFNGAATARSRNPLDIVGNFLNVNGASMGPRPRGRGIAAGICEVVLVDRASMGPRPRGRGIVEPSPCPVARLPASMGPRPRGRGISAAVTAQAPLLISASMGPRPRGRGIRKRIEGSMLDLLRFNGAATARSRNRRAKLNRPAAPNCFNGAATARSRNLLDGVPGSLSVNVLQWGRDRAVAESGALISFGPK